VKKKKDKKTELIEAIEARQPNPKDIEAAVKSFFDDVVFAPPSSHQTIREAKEASPIKEPSISLETQDNSENTTAVITAVDTEVDTEVKHLEEGDFEIQTIPLSEKRQRLKPGKEKEFVTLDSTHTKSEALVYSVMYRETISKGREEFYFSLRRLAKMTGIGSDKTVFNALKGLREKISIALVEHSNNSPIGTLYRVLTPKEIMEERKKRGIEINPFTKKLKSTAVVTAVDSEVSSAVKTTAVGAVETTAVTAVKTTAVATDIPYISKNNINRDDSIENIESSSKSSNKEDDTDDEAFSHRSYVISLYAKYTGNQWRVGDDEFYEAVKDVIPDIIEAAIIASVLRSKTRINSFAYCEGTIHEFQENLPPGYLSYLREKWREGKGRGTTEEHDD
jgi:hypothetical protein